MQLLLFSIIEDLWTVKTGTFKNVSSIFDVDFSSVSIISREREREREREMGSIIAKVEFSIKNSQP